MLKVEKVTFEKVNFVPKVLRNKVYKHFFFQLKYGKEKNR